MIDLFGDDGRAALERLARLRTLYAFDFDGTLAPIVERPDDAVAPATTVALLSRLASRVPTAIVTGRSIDDARKRLAFAPRHLVGNHGAEGVPGDADPSADEAHRRVARAWLAQWPAAIGPDAVRSGIVVEAKDYSLSIHYRQAGDHDAARRAIAAAVARLAPAPRVIGGKCVFNLLPAASTDKGRALRALVRFEACEAAFFIGDDLTDEVAFEAAPASWVTVRVGCDVQSAARYCVAAQADVDRCLEALVAAVQEEAPGTR